MTDPTVYQEIENAFRELNKVVEAESYEIDAEKVIQHLSKEGGEIEVIGDEFKPSYETVSEIRKRAEPNYNHTYGLDGSTTKDLSFNNGLIVSAGVAATGASERPSVDDINLRNTISIVTYFDDNDIDIDVEPKNESISLYMSQFPRISTNNISKLSDWISALARSDAESKHFEWVAKDISNPLFIDGPLIPADILTWILYNQIESPQGTPMEDWPEMIHSIAQSYINGIESCIRTQTPVYGIQKSTTATRVVDALKQKEPDLIDSDFPWTNDSMLFTAAINLKRVDESSIGYTPWYIEHKMQVGRSDKFVTPFKDYDEISFKYGEPEDYVRAFFFAKPPNQTTVYRVGVPKILFDIDGINKDTVRDIALCEMIKTYKEPLPVVLADEKVRVSRDIRDEFRRLFTTDAYIDHNEQRNYK